MFSSSCPLLFLMNTDCATPLLLCGWEWLLLTLVALRWYMTRFCCRLLHSDDSDKRVVVPTVIFETWRESETNVRKDETPSILSFVSFIPFLTLHQMRRGGMKSQNEMKRDIFMTRFSFISSVGADLCFHFHSFFPWLSLFWCSSWETLIMLMMITTKISNSDHVFYPVIDGFLLLSFYCFIPLLQFFLYLVLKRMRWGVEIKRWIIRCGRWGGWGKERERERVKNERSRKTQSSCFHSCFFSFWRCRKKEHLTFHFFRSPEWIAAYLMSDDDR